MNFVCFLYSSVNKYVMKVTVNSVTYRCYIFFCICFINSHQQG